jgi:hypothetical protein
MPGLWQQHLIKELGSSTNGVASDAGASSSAVVPIMKRRAIILGAGGHAVSLAETVVACGYELVGFVGVPRRGPHIFGIPIIPEVPADHLGNGGVLVMAEGGNWQREQATRALIDTPVTYEVFPALIHPSASVS